MRSGPGYTIDISAEDTKSKQPLELPLSLELSARFDFYLKEIRRRILGAEGNDYLWVDRCGPMSDRTIYVNVRRPAKEAIEVN